jgi:hypothetical protein
MPCPACKIIIDHPGALAAAARLLARTNMEFENAALYLADIATASADAITRLRGSLSAAEMDEAHAFSELGCHRAAVIRAETGLFPNDSQAQSNLSEETLLQWAEELRLHTTKLVGGEYEGAWTVDGVNGITPNNP